MTTPDRSDSAMPRAPLVLPKLERTGPRRVLTTVGRFDDVPMEHGASASTGRPLTSAKDVIEHALRVAQDVIDEQIGSGERILRYLRKAPVSKRRVSPLDAKHAASLTERTVVLTNELGVLAIEVLETMAESKTVVELVSKWLGLGAMSWAQGGSAASTRSAEGGAGQRIEVFVSSRKPAKVDARVFAPLSGEAQVLGLNRAGAPPITSIEYLENARAFRVSIPDDQPAGTYCGVIVSRDAAEALGTMIALVSDL